MSEVKSLFASKTIWGAFIAIIAGGMLSLGLSRLRATTLVPQKSIDQIRADVAAVKEHVT